MILEEKIKIAKVWHIDNNELKCCNKKIAIINYKDVEIAILKQEKNWSTQNLLIKDKNNEYWQLGIIPIKFNLFSNTVITDKEGQNRAEQYRNETTEVYKNMNLKKFWQKKIERDEFFNKCELAYIEKYYPDILEKAIESRKIFERDRDKRYEEEKINRQIQEKKEVKKTNSIFQKELKEMKYTIFTGGTVIVKDFEFYKDNKYENGKTIQNNVLYLAKEYGINIPLATQGFINNRLVRYNLNTKEVVFKIINNNKKCSTKIGIYLNKIYEKVKEEVIEKIKRQNKKIIEVR